MNPYKHFETTSDVYFNPQTSNLMTCNSYISIKSNAGQTIVDAIPAQANHLLLQLIKNLFLTPCKHGCEKDYYICLNSVRNVELVQDFKVTWEGACKALDSVSFDSRKNRILEQELKKWSEEKTLNIFPELLGCFAHQNQCLYCGIEMCPNPHYQLKLAILLHKPEVWFNDNGYLHISAPMLSQAKGSAEVEWITFILSEDPQKHPKTFMMRGADGGYWRTPELMEQLNHFLIRIIFEECQSHKESEIPSLLEMGAKALMMSGNRNMPENLALPQLVQSIQPIWTILYDQECITPDWFCPCPTCLPLVIQSVKDGEITPTPLLENQSEVNP